MEITLDSTYKGPYEHVGVTEGVDGGANFSSWQRLISTGQVAEGATDHAAQLEINAVDWRVAPDGILTGTAKFISTTTFDVINATLRGTSPAPPQGQKFREALVTVTFNGGTRGFSSATGTAKVEAKLYDDGISVGTIKGKVKVPGARVPGKAAS
jgi:hypothetical protein